MKNRMVQIERSRLLRIFINLSFSVHRLIPDSEKHRFDLKYDTGNYYFDMYTQIKIFEKKKRKRYVFEESNGIYIERPRSSRIFIKDFCQSSVERSRINS